MSIVAAARGHIWQGLRVKEKLQLMFIVESVVDTCGQTDLRSRQSTFLLDSTCSGKRCRTSSHSLKLTTLLSPLSISDRGLPSAYRERTTDIIRKPDAHPW